MNKNSMDSECCGMQPCAIETTMAKLPSDAWLVAALGSIGLSLLLKMNGRRDDSRFIGDWAAPFLLLGVYTKLLKMESAKRGTMTVND